MIISHIVAVSKNFVIGKNNRLPWKMPDDINYFHRVTDGHIVIMGRKNYEANRGALKNRTNIVITRSQNFRPADATVVHNIQAAISYAEEFHPEEVFIVGGGEIYRQTLSMANRIYLTLIDVVIDGDSWYPEIDFEAYNVISKISKNSDQRNPYDHIYYILEPKK